MTPDEAQDAALRSFGNPTRLREPRHCGVGTGCNDYGETFARERQPLYALPAFTAVAVLVTPLGIGGTVTLFTMVNAVLLKPLPFQDPDKYRSELTD